MKLTKGLKEKIAEDAARDLFAKSLLIQFSDVCARIEDLVKESYSDFDFKNVEPYRNFINWHKGIKILVVYPHKDWNICWDTFRQVCKLPNIESLDLSFEIPSKSEYTPYLDEEYRGRAVEILRPYMISYLAAKKAYNEMKQVLAGINTLKQLEESVPELVKYLPNSADGAVTALVPIEQINRVRNLFKRNQEVV